MPFSQVAESAQNSLNGTEPAFELQKQSAVSFLHHLPFVYITSCIIWSGYKCFAFAESASAGRHDKILTQYSEIVSQHVEIISPQVEVMSKLTCQDANLTIKNKTFLCWH